MVLEPSFAGQVNFFDDGFGEGVGVTPGEENEGVVLISMREAEAVFLDGFFRVEEHGAWVFNPTISKD